MWKYNKTNEIYDKINNYYKAIEDYNYLSHANHKYIKRVWKNGHWVYYYDGSLDKERNTYRDDLMYNIKNGTVAKTTKKGYTYKSPYDGKTYDYKHYRKAFMGDYKSYLKLDNKIKKAKKIAEALNKIEKMKIKKKKKK